MNDTLLSGRAAAVAVAVFGLAIVVSILVAPAASGPEPAGSSLSTERAGYAAVRTLLAESGYDVDHLTTSVAVERPPPDATLFVVRAVLEESEVTALERFVTAGGRLVVIDTIPVPFDGPAPAFASDFDPRHSVVLPHPEFGGVTDLSVNGARLFADAGPMVPLYGNESGDLVVAHHEDSGGAMFAVANQSVLQNAGLANADNAALGLALAGTRPRVLFAEYVHGIGGSGGMPWRWQFALGAIAVAGLIWLFAKSRRFGPPTPQARELPPARVGYVDALAAGLRKSQQPRRAVAGLRREIERRLVGRTGAVTPTPEELEATAVRLGVAPEDARLAFREAGDTESVLAVGRVLAALSKEQA